MFYALHYILGKVVENEETEVYFASENLLEEYDPFEAESTQCENDNDTFEAENGPEDEEDGKLKYNF